MKRLAMVFLLVGGVARGQEPEPEAPKSTTPIIQRPRCSDAEPAGAGDAGKTKYEVVTGPDGKKIFRIKTGFVICGKVPKPDVLYGLLSTTINYEWETLKQDFLPKVLKSVEQAPF